MNKIETAEEFVRKRFQNSNRADFLSNKENVIEFTKIHIEAALKEASKKVKRKEGTIVDYKLTNSILNSYPLELIK